MYTYFTIKVFHVCVYTHIYLFVHVCVYSSVFPVLSYWKNWAHICSLNLCQILNVLHHRFEMFGKHKIIKF